MDIETCLRNFLTGVERRGAPTPAATLNAARRAYGTWEGVAAELGISARTLRRIRASGARRLSPRSRSRIEDLSRRPAVRRAAVTPAAARRLRRMETRPTKVVIDADQGPRGHGRGDYIRRRTIEFEIPPSDMMNIADAFFNGDDDEALALFEDAIEQHYGRGEFTGWDIQELHNINMSV